MKPIRYNTQTKQMHRIAHLKPECNAGHQNICPAGPHWRECGRLKAWLLMTFRRYDGCGHCWPAKNKNR